MMANNDDSILDQSKQQDIKTQNLCMVSVSNSFSDSAIMSASNRNTFSQYIFNIYSSNSFWFNILVYFTFTINNSQYSLSFYPIKIGLIPCIILFLSCSTIIFFLHYSIITLIQISEKKQGTFFQFINNNFGSLAAKLLCAIVILWYCFTFILTGNTFKEIFKLCFNSIINQNGLKELCYILIMTVLFSVYTWPYTEKMLKINFSINFISHFLGLIVNNNYIFSFS